MFSTGGVHPAGILVGRNGGSRRLGGVVSFLLHCNASNLVLEILKHDKVGGSLH